MLLLRNHHWDSYNGNIAHRYVSKISNSSNSDPSSFIIGRNHDIIELKKDYLYKRCIIMLSATLWIKYNKRYEIYMTTRVLMLI